MDLDLPPFLQNLYLRRKELLIGASSVIAGIAILIAYFESGPGPNTYAVAEAAFSKWESSPFDEQLYNEMRNAIRKTPALERKYEAFIAQKLLDAEKTEEALRPALHSLVRIQQDTPFHASYANCSLLIGQGDYQEALQKAVELKDSMKNSFDLAVLSGEKLVGGSLLYAFNLLRIACLQMELQNGPGEKAAWEEFEAFIRGNSSVSELVIGNFSEKNVDLIAYIDTRKKSL